ncbi:S24 family peptidase [Orbaceae bacterium ac157xtp]
MFLLNGLLVTGKGECRLSTAYDAKGTIHIPFYQSKTIKTEKEAVHSAKPKINSLPFDLSWTRYRGLNTQNLYAYWAKGDSMSPAICDNDALVINTADSIPFDGYIYLIEFGNALIVKRIQNQGKHLLLISDNEKYPPLKIEKNSDHAEFNIVGRVVYIVKDLQ